MKLILKMAMLLMTGLTTTSAMAATCGSLANPVGARRGVGDFVLTTSNGQEIFIGVRDVYGGRTILSMQTYRSLQRMADSEGTTCVIGRIAQSEQTGGLYFRSISSVYFPGQD